ncbi:MAG: hypothetical protein ACTHZI_01580 [Luteimonas sp.]
MSVSLRELFLLLPVAAAMALCAPAQAQRQQQPVEHRGADVRAGQQRASQPQERGGRQERRQDSMADSIRYVRRSSRGQILSAERMHSNGREINRIKVVDDRGRVRVFEDDPQRRRNQRSRGDDD